MGKNVTNAESKYLDDDGYPTEEALEMIEKFELKSNEDWHKLMAIVKEMWAYPQCFTKYGDRYTLITLGWSGNESIIRALKRNCVFHLMYWESSEMGGRHIYQPILWQYRKTLKKGGVK